MGEATEHLDALSRELAAFENLVSLNLEETGVTDLSPLAKLPLLSLNLKSSKVTSLENNPVPYATAPLSRKNRASVPPTMRPGISSAPG